MPYSKIFSDLLELTYEVIKYFMNDFLTLFMYLVNRLWCRLAIPLLYGKIHFQFLNKIIIYLRNLSGDLKAKLNEYKKRKENCMELKCVIIS
ncbi:hypothetical protein RhiirA1_476103 [Rhizophagus irregularis]|uniref:Uncharacterized protein n=1 Tax=Rhizophagus irregularis TaxID=588596 RepID=A0A2N0QVQ6_9GLOM|nr:hypothetical protein RhiirA1_476103 [Rhizophagus irregularis]GET62467.1 hypothetical protein GLOIN_2v1767498 [Rhizophagus irregularis DAOM 181602=DAOM 197198]